MVSIGNRDVINVSDILRDVREIIDNLLSSPGAKAAGAFVISVLHWLYGDLGPVHAAMGALIIADWASGLWYAFMSRQISSAKSLRGVVKLGIYAGIFLVSAQVDRVQVIGPLLSGSLLSTMVITESISVLENLDKIARRKGIEMPLLRPLIQRLSQSAVEQIGRRSL